MNSTKKMTRVIYDAIHAELGDELFTRNKKTHSAASLANLVAGALQEEFEEEIDEEVANAQEELRELRELLRELVDVAEIDLDTVKSRDQRFLGHYVRVALSRL